MKKLLLMLLCFPVLGSYSQDWEKNYDYVDNCLCGLSKVKKDDKVGYVNEKGVVVIKLLYDDGLSFNEGYVAIKKGAMWFFMDSTGKPITDAVYEDALSFSDGLAAVGKNGLYGYINTSGIMVIPFQFNSAHNFSEGFAPASNAKGFWGYIDRKGNWAISPVYDYTVSFTNGEARVIKNSKVFYIDKNNKVLRNLE